MMVLDFIFYYRISFSNVCLFRIINLDNHNGISRLLLFWLILGPMIRYWVEQEYQANADNTSLLTEAINGIETIK